MSAPTLPEFILARVAEDEARMDDTLTLTASGPVYASVSGGSSCAIGVSGNEYTVQIHNPARVLAQCAAFRAVVAEHEMLPQTYATSKKWDGPTEGCGVCHESGGYVYPHGPCLTLCLLATIWADHPEYRKEWAA